MSTKYQSGLRVSEYLLEECVGTGSFGEVWRAKHHMWPDERVAVKLPTEPEYVRYLRREGAMVHGLRHPNIIRVMGIDPYAENPYLVMELVEGPSLREVLREHPTGLDIDTTVTIMRGLLNGLKTAHEANVLHRDIKPGNIMLHLSGKPLEQLSEEDVKVGDFGLGVGDPDMLRSIAQSASLNRDDNKLVGTLAYMAPELRDGDRKADARADLYAVGVVLFELLTGERPAGAELPGTMRSTVPPALDEIFRRLYTRYERRYESAEKVLEELDRRLRSDKESAEQDDVLPVPPLPRDPSIPPIPRHASGSTCRACGKSIEAHDQFCIHCGVQVTEKIRQCPQCNSYPGPHDRFCIFCGTSLPAMA